MDREITVRFYEIQAIEGGARAWESILREIADLPKPEREKGVPGDVTLRLEHLDERDGLLFGDFTRVQTENLPGHVTEAENAPLPVERLGHPAAFCFDPETHCIALQYDAKIGIGRACVYVNQFSEIGRFGPAPILREDAMEHLENETPSKLTLKISQRRNFRTAELPMTDFEDQLDAMAATFDAPSIEVSVSCRRTDEGLDRNQVLNTIRRWLGYREQANGITKVSAETLESDEAYNLLRFLLKEHETLDLPKNDPLDGRTKRLRFVRQKYAQHRAYLREYVGVA